MSYRSAGLILLILAASVLLEKPHAWETAEVISQDLGSEAAGTYAAPIGNARVAVPIYRRWNIVVVETDLYRYPWQDQGKNVVVLVVNDNVKFYLDGQQLIVLDIKNKPRSHA